VASTRSFKEYGWSLTSGSVNWGDLLLREIADYFFDFNMIRRAYSGAFFGGSVLDISRIEYFKQAKKGKPILAVSCGARNSKDHLEPPANLEIHGVRGHGTADLLPNSIPTGDPGMLAPIVFGIEPITTTEFRKIIIPHFSQTSVPKRMENEIFSTMLPFGRSSKSLVVEINKSSFVLAGSLHAGICAFSTGTPFAFSLGGSSEDPFKYYDFASFYGISISFQENFQDAMRWYLEEESLHLPRAAEDFKIYTESLSVYARNQAINFDLRIAGHVAARNSVHASKLNSLRAYVLNTA